MEDKLKSILEHAVENKIPVIEAAVPDVFPCITFHFYNVSGYLFGGGTATEVGAKCQVDLWYNKRTEPMKSAIKALKQAIINEKEYLYPQMETSQEAGTKKWHTYFNFEVIIESEE